MSGELCEYHTCSMLAFTPITQHKAGILAALLLESYAEVVSAEQQYWLAEKEKWLEFDREVFENPQTIGRCVFVTIWETEVVGFGSFEPRQRPESATIGHNCIVPRFQGRGYGRQQVMETLARFRKLGVRKAIVATNEHPFFSPAQRMYLSCGFEESRRYAGGPDPRYRMIEYRREAIL